MTKTCILCIVSILRKGCGLAEIDARYAARMRECQKKIRDQIAIVRTMTEFMDSMADGKPNMALICGENVSKAVNRTEPTQNSKEEQEPEVIVIDLGGEDQATSIINEAEAQGIIDEPEVAFMSQLMHYIRNSETISFGRLDGLEALKNDGLISEENYNCLLDIYEQTKGSGNYNIFDLKEQARNVYTEIERVIAERTIVEKYINEDVLRDVLGWDLNKIDPRLGDNFIEEMKALMLEYGLTDERSIILFLVTITHECGRGSKITETGGKAYLDEKPTYTYYTRGAGVIQLTGANQEVFLQYMYDRSNDDEEKEELLKYLNGFWKIEYDINGDKITKVYNQYDVATFIAENYALEASIWYWCNNEYADLDGHPRSINYLIETYCENDKTNLEQYLIATQLTVHGCVFKSEVLGRFYNSENQVFIDNGGRANIIYKEYGANDRGEHHFCDKPGNWEDRFKIYQTMISYIMQN